MFSDLSQSPLSKNLQRLFWLRNIAIAAQCLTIGLVYWTIDIEIPWAQLVLVVALLALINFLTWIRLHRKWPVSHLEFQYR